MPLRQGIGQANNASLTTPCSPSGSPIGPCQGPTSHGQLHVSRSPYGPWQLVRNKVNGSDHIITSGNTNPAPYIFPNGSLIVSTCGNNVYYADHWSGPYVYLGQLPFTAMNNNRTDLDSFCENCAPGKCRLMNEDRKPSPSSFLPSPPPPSPHTLVHYPLAWHTPVQL